MARALSRIGERILKYGVSWAVIKAAFATGALFGMLGMAIVMSAPAKATARLAKAVLGSLQ